MLKHAFKEWAVICRALAEGRQSLILRKGGIAEPGGEFALEQKHFWLFPTYVHQQQTGIKPEARTMPVAGAGSNSNGNCPWKGRCRSWMRRPFVTCCGPWMECSTRPRWPEKLISFISPLPPVNTLGSLPM